MAAKCNACGKFIRSTGGATCTCRKCSGIYHKACVALPDTLRADPEWVCPECTTRTPKGDNTPARAAVREKQEASPGGGLQNTTSASLATTSLATPLDLSQIHSEFSTWMKEMREFRQEMSEFRSSLLGLSTRMDSIESRLVIIEGRPEESRDELVSLRNHVTSLQQELNERDQDALLSDLEIGQLPEEKGENVIHTVTVLAAKLGVVLEERDLVFAERVGVAQGAGPGAEPPRPRRIVVRLARRGLRDSLLQGARVRRTLTAADAGQAAGTRPRIFVNERLSRYNRNLFYRAREECKKEQWRFVWTRRGRVHIRQADGKQAYLIRSEADLLRVFGFYHLLGKQNYSGGLYFVLSSICIVHLCMRISESPHQIALCTGIFTPANLPVYPRTCNHGDQAHNLLIYPF